MDFLRMPGTDFDAGQIIHDVTKPLLSFRERAIDAYAVPLRRALEWSRDDARAALEGLGREAVQYWNHYGQVDGLADLPLGAVPRRFRMREQGFTETSLA